MLDVGCGTGIVTHHLGSIYPSASVYGIDISPVPSTDSSDAIPQTPPNVKCIIDDVRKLAEEDQQLKSGSFNCIFQRLLICGMTQWQTYISQMATLPRPGGWLKIQDYAEICFNAKESDRTVSDSWKWQNAMRRGAAQRGLDLDVGLNTEGHRRKAGLVDVKVEKCKAPFGTWMADEKPETRRSGAHDYGTFFSESILPSVTRNLGLGEAEMGDPMEECKGTFKWEAGKYWVLYVTVGRRK